MVEWMKNVKHAVFGLFDGLTVVLGVIIGLYSSHPDLILTTAVAVGVAEAIGMFSGEWLSETKSGLRGPIVIGVATCTGSILPALPFALVASSVAAWLAASIFLVCAAAIAAARAAERGWVRSNIETVGILTVTSAVVWVMGILQ